MVSLHAIVKLFADNYKVSVIIHESQCGILKLLKILNGCVALLLRGILTVIKRFLLSNNYCGWCLNTAKDTLLSEHFKAQLEGF